MNLKGRISQTILLCIVCFLLLGSSCHALVETQYLELKGSVPKENSHKSPAFIAAYAKSFNQRLAAEKGSFLAFINSIMENEAQARGLKDFQYSDVCFRIKDYLDAFPEDFHLLKAAIYSVDVIRMNEELKKSLDLNWSGNYKRFLSFHLLNTSRISNKKDFDVFGWSHYLTESVTAGKQHELRLLREGVEIRFYNKLKQELIYSLCKGQFAKIKKILSTVELASLVFEHKVQLLIAAGFSRDEALFFVSQGTPDPSEKQLSEIARKDVFGAVSGRMGYFDLLEKKGLLSKEERDNLAPR